MKQLSVSLLVWCIGIAQVRQSAAFVPPVLVSPSTTASTSATRTTTPATSIASLQERPLSSTQLQFFFASSPSPSKKVFPEDGIPFIIERISQTAPNEDTFAEIAEVCINVFFKEQLGAKPKDRIPPWKEVQISYLKALQGGDLRRRRQRYANSNEMFLAYEVLPATGNDVLEKPLILDLDQVCNLRPENDGGMMDYVRGNLVGFVEITQRPYGLGALDESGTLRPILTNLAVAKKARKSGIGSELLDECENHVAAEWEMSEIVLEVEDYNTPALGFYSNRGYEVLFRNPASRRYDVSGMMLRKERCTREIMRKSLALQRARAANEISFDFFQRFRASVGV